jgi:hypothetical protein
MALLAQVSTLKLIGQEVYLSSLQKTVIGEAIQVPYDMQITGVTTYAQKLVFSTLGFDDMFIYASDLGTRYILEGSNFPQNIVLPDVTTLGVGWNVLINNQFTNFASFSLLENTTSNVIGTINPGTSPTIVYNPNTGRWTYY